MSREGQAVALVPARAGSKRLPGKNTRPFFGHPMLAYGIAAALNSKLFERVIVSSDDPALERVAVWYGAKFILRPAELAADTAGLAEVAVHALDCLRKEGSEPEALCQIMPNCPLVRSVDLIEHWRLFRDCNRSFQISVVPYRAVYPHWALRKDEQGRGEWMFGEKYVVRSQDLACAVCPTGAIWLTRTHDFLVQHTFYGTPFHLAPMDANRGVDIDDAEDLALAELLVHGLSARDGVSPLEPMDRKSYLCQEAPLA